MNIKQIICTLALTAGIGRAEIVYNNFGSNDTYVAFDPAASALGTGYVGLAVPFVPSNCVTLDSITVAMAQDAGTGPVRLTVLTDDSGKPGTNVVETFLASGFLSGTGSVGTVSSITHPHLQPGVTYWIAAHLTSTNDVYQWHGAGIAAFQRAYDVGAGWQTDLESTYALRVEGTSTSGIDCLIALVTNSNLPAKRKHPLLVTLRAADRSYNRGKCKTGDNQLKAFKNKVRAQVVRLDAVLAATLTSAAQDIIDAPCTETKPHGNGHGHGHGKPK